MKAQRTLLKPQIAIVNEKGLRGTGRFYADPDIKFIQVRWENNTVTVIPSNTLPAAWYINPQQFMRAVDFKHLSDCLFVYAAVE